MCIRSSTKLRALNRNRYQTRPCSGVGLRLMSFDGGGKAAGGIGRYKKRPVAMGGHEQWARYGGAARLDHRIGGMVG